MCTTGTTPRTLLAMLDIRLLDINLFILFGMTKPHVFYFNSPGVIVTELQKRGGMDDETYAKVRK